MKNKIVVGVLLFIFIASALILHSSFFEENEFVTTSYKDITYDDIMYNVENPRSLVELDEPISKTDATLLHTVSQITLYDVGDEQLLNECFAIINYYENLLSSNEQKAETSEIYKLNNSNGEVVTLSDDVLECFTYGYEYSKNSYDTFDITIGQLTSLWNFEEATKAPRDEDIKEAVKTVDYNNIVLNGNDVYLTNPDTKIDLGAIAKGFIADKVAMYLRSQGVESAIINLGGNVYALGHKDNETGQKFKVAIRKPVAYSQEQIGYVEVSDMSIVSSGDYEQFFVDEETGKTYSHILDKSTGYPMETDIAQVSIFSEKSVDGDGLSTIVYSLGSEKGLEYIENIDNTECIIVKKDGSIIFSSGVGETPDKDILFVPSE